MGFCNLIFGYLDVELKVDMLLDCIKKIKGIFLMI